MSLFCLLWIPLLYLLRRSVSDEGGGGGVWALLLGSVTAIFQFFLGDIAVPGGFGLSRWISTLCILLRLFSGGPDFAGFILLWLIPVAALRALSWSSRGDPILLVLSPLLWSAQAVGISFFISLIIRHFRWYVLIPSALCIAALPPAAATAWWAFFSQQPRLGVPILAAVLIPLLVSTIRDIIEAG